MLGLIFFLVILANYYLLPRINVPIRAVLPGAIVATVGIMVVTWLYSIYTERATSHNLLYGAFSSIVAMMLWFYMISWVLCIGMMFNKLIIGEYDMTDRSLDSLAVRVSRKLDPGYEEKREKEIRELQEERKIRLRIEKEISDELEGTFIDADPVDDSLLKQDFVPDFEYRNRPADVSGKDKVIERTVRDNEDE